jgi:hypothetical protein
MHNTHSAGAFYATALPCSSCQTPQHHSKRRLIGAMASLGELMMMMMMMMMSKQRLTC